MNTSAQIAAAAALDLPFDLEEADIARMFAADGSKLPQAAEAPQVRAKALAHQAMILQMPTAEQVAAFRAERKAQSDRIRAGWQADHAARNTQAQAEAAARKAERQARHQETIKAARSAKKAA